MEVTRRDLMGLAMMLGLAPATRAAELFEPALQDEPIDEATLRFWQRDVRLVQSSNLTPGVRKIDRGLIPGTERVPEFFSFQPEAGFQPASDLDTEKLPGFGDIKVSVQVANFRPSKNDQKMFTDAKSGSLRIDMQQTKPVSQLIDVMAWSAVAAVDPKSSAATNLQNMKLDLGNAWGQKQAVPLPGGGGTWTWNFFLQKKDSLMGKIHKLFQAGAQTVVPIMGLPGVAKTALTAFDNFFGHVQSSSPSEWVFQGSAVPVAATKEARSAFRNMDIVMLQSGSYLVVPRLSYSEIGKQMDKLELKKGLVVPKGTKSTDVFEAAADVIPDTTYLTLDVQVNRV